MSPEQARGRQVDRRTDIWSFGCLLFECFTGRQLFTGETVSDVLAKILEREPDWDALPARVPGRARDLLRRCLEKDPKRRLRDIGDARLQVEEALGDLRSRSAVGVGVGGGAGRGAGARAGGAGLLSARGVAMGAALAVIGAVAGIAGWSWLGPGAALSGRLKSFEGMTHVSITWPPGIRMEAAGLLPDGTGVGGMGRPRPQAGGQEAASMLYTRRFDGFDVKAMPGSEGVVNGFPSAEGRMVYFVAPASRSASALRLFRAPFDGGAPPIGLGEWKDNWRAGVALYGGGILVTMDGGARYQLLSADGAEVGEPRAVDAGDFRGTLVPISVLPGDRGVLMDGIAYGARGWYFRIALLDPATGRVRFLLDDGGKAVYVPTGHLLFTRGDVLLAAPFDLSSLALTGSAVPILNGLYTRFVAEPAEFSVGENGSLLYRPGGVVMNDRRLALVDASGGVTPWTEERRAYGQKPAVSGDGRSVAITITNGQGIDEVWLSDLDRPSLRRVAAVPDADCSAPALSPDGRMLAFLRQGRDDKDGIYVQRADGQGEPRRIYRPPAAASRFLPYEWSPDGASFLIGEVVEGRSHIRVVSDAPGAGGAGEEPPPPPRPLIQGFLDDFTPTFSPDGRMLAFGSNESGRTEVYVCAVRPDGTVDHPVRVSTGGGDTPLWGPGGRTLLYTARPRRLMSVAMTGGRAAVGGRAAAGEVAAGSGTSITAGPAVQVADLERLRIGEFAVLSDGRLFGVLRGDRESGEITEQHLVLDFFDLLRRRMAGAGGGATPS
jgi:serine/threonine-protein kinase